MLCPRYQDHNISNKKCLKGQQVTTLAAIVNQAGAIAKLWWMIEYLKHIESDSTIEGIGLKHVQTKWIS
jgi:hypothetical protein